MHPVLEFLVGIVPSVGVALLFWFVIRLIIRADRRERAAIARLEAAERAAAPTGAPVTGPGRVSDERPRVRDGALGNGRSAG